MFEAATMHGLCFVVRKFYFILSWFFVVYITGVTAFKLYKVVNKDEVTPSRHVEYFASNLNFFWVKRILLIEFDLIQWLRSWSKGFVYLAINA